MSEPFRVGLSHDLLDGAGQPSFGAAPLRLLGDCAWEWLPPLAAIGARELATFDALYVNTPSVPADAFAGPVRTRVIARHGVGYDAVDVAACTRAGVLLTIQPDAVRRPVAVAALTLVLALSQRLLIKDRLTRAGQWGARLGHMGVGLRGRTLGVVGAGRIGQELLGLARPFGLRLLAADPAVPPSVLAELGAQPAELGPLLEQSDFVVLLVPLTPATTGLLGARELARMRPTAFLINVARGPVVDERALADALAAGAIAGAGLDVFAQEPVDAGNPLLAMHNVIVTPHALCWTDELFAALAISGFESILAVRRGIVPANAVNPEAAAARG